MNNEINQTTFESKRKLDNNDNHTSGNISLENESETKKF